MLHKLLDQDLADPSRALRDVVALSTLPAIWLGADSARLAESLAAALFTTIGPEFVYVAVQEGPEAAPVSVAQTDRHLTDAALAASLGPRILEWAREHDPDDLLCMPHPRGTGEVRIATRPLGFNASYGVLAAGFTDPAAPTPLHHVMLGLGATQAAAAVQNAMLLHSLRENIAQRERVEAALREADRRKDEFLAMLSHELRNPLAPITTAIQLMRLRGADIPELGALERQTGHLRRLVDDLLDVSRITQGKIELRKQRIEIADAMLRAMEMAAALLEQRSHNLDITGVPRKGLAVDADPERLAQIVFNLVSNAAKYSPTGSTIALRAWSEESRVRLSVADNGAGIAPELIERIFDMFVQQEQTLARSDGGLGLGLTIVRSLVELHGGSVSARSAGAGSGSEFIVDLPVAAQATVMPGPARAPVAAVSPRRVLLVDDNIDAAAALDVLLKTLGHDVLVAADGPQALARAQHFEPDIAFLDIGLPGMDGYELARRLRERCPRATLVALTGYGLPGDRARSAQAGFSEHLVKPVDIARLNEILAGFGTLGPAAAEPVVQHP